MDAGYIEIKNWITLSGLDDIDYKVGGTVVIDGIMLDYGFETAYMPYDPTDERTGSPEGVDTGRMIDDPAKQVQHQLIHSDAAIAGNVIIRNCLFLNSPYFGIQINTRCGEIEVCNCVFVSNRMGGVRIDGWDKEGYRSHVNFHHNSVGFSWCRDKIMEDMGYGYEFMNKVSGDIDEKVIPKIDGNKNMPADDPWVKVLWDPYLVGFANLKVLDSSSSFDANSAANLYRQAHGMNMQGTMIHRVSMYGNRYRFEEAMKLFGAKAGYGAQK